MARTFAIALIALAVLLPRFVVADEPTESSSAAPEPASPPTEYPVATHEQIEQAIERTIPYLQAESAAWRNTRKCAACHHVPTVLWSLGEADRQGYTIDRQYVLDTLEASIGSRENMIAVGLLPRPDAPPSTRPVDNDVQVSHAFIAVAARSLGSLTKLSDGQLASLELIADGIAHHQREDGGWNYYLCRPPINESEATDAAWLIMALQDDVAAADAGARRAALDKALAWWNGRQASDHLQDRIFQMLILSRAGKPREELQATAAELLALQRPDGGWGQTPDLPTDAYATGQALYVLALAGYTAERAEVARAINLLVATQRPEGNWPMASRSTPDGSPGSSKLLTPIESAAACWALLGLGRLAPKTP